MEAEIQCTVCSADDMVGVGVSPLHTPAAVRSLGLSLPACVLWFIFLSIVVPPLEPSIAPWTSWPQQVDVLSVPSRWLQPRGTSASPRDKKFRRMRFTGRAFPHLQGTCHAPEVIRSPLFCPESFISSWSPRAHWHQKRRGLAWITFFDSELPCACAPASRGGGAGAPSAAAVGRPGRSLAVRRGVRGSPGGCDPRAQPGV